MTHPVDADANHAILDHDQMEREIVQGEGEHLVWINHAVDNNVGFKARLTPPPATEKVTYAEGLVSVST